MARYKGGRGKKAPYETQLVRVPVPLLDTVRKLIAEFRGNLPDIPDIPVTTSDKTDIPVTSTSDKTDIPVTTSDKTDIPVTTSDKTDIPVTTSDKAPHKKIPVTSNDRWVPEPEGEFTPLWDLGISGGGVVRLREHFASIEQLLPLNADDLAALNIKNPQRVVAAVEEWKKRRWKKRR